MSRQLLMLLFGTSVFALAGCNLNSLSTTDTFSRTETFLNENGELEKYVEYSDPVGGDELEFAVMEAGGKGKGNGNGGDDPSTSESNCYRVSGAKWRKAPDWNVGGGYGEFSREDLIQILQNVADEWNRHTGKSVIGNYSPEGSGNLISFYEFENSSIGAQTQSNQVMGGNGKYTIYRFRILINTQVTWSKDGQSGIDLQSVLTHEMGHAIGMGHAPMTTECGQETMSPFVLSGISMRDLFLGDIAGLNVLY